MDWVYKQIIGFLANFFAEMGNMGAEMFEMSWVQSIVLFFSYLAWILYAVGFVVACAECGLEYSSGRADIKGTAMNLIKGFMAVSLFTVVPIRLYELCVSLQANFGYAISGAGASFGTVAGNIIDELTVENFVDFATTHVGGFGSVTSPIMVLFCIILMAYAVIKVFFANLKRGGILLIQIAVGSLYMFSVPRGYLRTKELLSLENPPDAVFCCYDQMAIGAIHALRESGLRIPEDMAVMGFDNLTSSKYIEGGITTIANPYEDMLSVAVNILTKRTKNPQMSQQQITLRPNLVVRHTT